ncbi:MAG: glycosyltransferase [Lactobacillaceae bacterium]|jgi:glycosyltransferase involved in cell wall biosynthesis|nr:glycosyltransferase [Lactobacillaceae bacterium]
MKVMVVKDRNVLNTKFLTQFVNSLAEVGHEVHVVCDSYNKQGKGAELSGKVKFTNLNAKTKNPLINVFRFCREKFFIPCFRYKKFIKKEKPDVIICYFMNDLFNVSFMQKHNIPIIMMMHCYPSIIFGKIKKKPFFLRGIYQKIVENVAVFQVLMKSHASVLSKYYKVKKIVDIPNAVEQIPTGNRADLSIEKKKIIYVARVEKEGKRQHLIIEAFAKIAEKFPEWVVEFWGLQKYKKYNEELMNLAQKYDIEKNIYIMGYSNNIQEVYKDADFQVFPSLHEGFGLGLADGMAMGLPSIGFVDTPSVNELIITGHNGYLVKDVEELAEKMEVLMGNKALRIDMGEKAAKDMEKYDPRLVTEAWDKLIKETVMGRLK